MRGDSANPCSHPDPRRRALARVGSRRRVLDPDWLTRRVRRITGIAPLPVGLRDHSKVDLRQRPNEPTVETISTSF